MHKKNGPPLTENQTTNLTKPDLLRETDFRFRVMADHAPVLVWMSNPQGLFNYFNKPWLAFTGRTIEQESGNGWTENLHPDERSLFVETYKNSFEAKQEFKLRCRLRRHDGEWRWFLNNGVPVFSQENEFLGFIGSCIDITETMYLEEQFWQRSSVVEFSNDAIITKSLAGIITSWNNSAQRIFGYTSAEVIGKPVTILFPPDHINEEPEILRRIQRGELMNHYETVRRRKDGSTFPISLTISPIKDSTGKIIGASKVARDISGQKAYEKRLVEQANELEQFAYVASHDLQEPLRKVSIYSDLLISRFKGNLDPEAVKYAGYVSDAVKRMQNLIHELLNYSRSNRSDQTWEVLDLAAAMNDVIESLEIAIRETKASITFGKLPSIQANAFQMHQLLQNLLSNALKFHGAQSPRIEISAREVGDQVIVAIKDNGIGIEDSYQEQVFRVFQRLHTSKEYPGTGIGLAICKKIVENHGGRIWVESKYGQGSTFYFSVPSSLKKDNSGS